MGSGLTGLLVARRALQAGKKVVILERGVEYAPDEFDRNTWWKEETRIKEEYADGTFLYANEFAGASKYFDDLAQIEGKGHPWTFQYNMWRGVGGSSQMWSGMAWRLCPDDFQTKSKFGYGTDWPISYAEMAPYYDRAEELLEVAGPSPKETASYKYWPWSNNFQYPPFKLSYLDKKFQSVIGDEGEIVAQPHAVRNKSPEDGGCVGAKTCVSYCPTKAIFKGNERILPEILFDDNLIIMSNACATRIIWKNDGDIIEGIEALDHETGVSTTIEAETYFLCANALENIRLIKSSEMLNGGAFGDSSRYVGKYFSSHAALTYTVDLEEKVFPVRGRPTHGSVIEWVAREQGEYRTGVTMEVWNSNFIRGYHPKRHFEVLAEEGHWGNYLFDTLERYEHQFCVSMIFETEMVEEKEVSLSTRNFDKFGLPLARADVQLTSLDLQSVRFIEGKIDQIRNRFGVRSIEMNGCGLNGNHPLGGLRMSDSADTGVVDSFSRCHDFKNLYILGGGAFCSTGSFNPTLTITALALRALDDPRLGW